MQNAIITEKFQTAYAGENWRKVKAKQRNGQAQTKIGTRHDRKRIFRENARMYLNDYPQSSFFLRKLSNWL